MVHSLRNGNLIGPEEVSREEIVELLRGHSRDIRDEAWTVRGAAQPRKCLGQAAVGRTDDAHLIASITDCTSLSPRPDRFTRMTVPSATSRASCVVYAIACADSSAGKIPSCLARA